MPTNPKLTPDAARATAPAMTPLPSAIASGLSGGFEEMLRIIKPPLCHLVQTADMGRLIHVRHVNYCRKPSYQSPLWLRSRDARRTPQTDVDTNTKRPITPTRTTRKSHAAGGPRTAQGGAISVLALGPAARVPPYACGRPARVPPCALVRGARFPPCAPVHGAPPSPDQTPNHAPVLEVLRFVTMMVLRRREPSHPSSRRQSRSPVL